jgi:aromatic-L-amino-acid decarboxylase
MSPDEFRARAHEAVEWVASYMERVGDLPVRAQVEPGEVRAAMPDAPPEHPEDWGEILADLDRVVLPGTTHWQSPSFFAYFNGNTSGPAVIGELVAAGLGVQGMLWSTGPACTEVETQVLDWLADLLDLPARFRSTGPGGGVIQDGASSANLCALLAARQRAGGAEVVPRLVAYTSREAHSSVEKGARVAGLAADQLRLVDVDPATRAMRPDDLRDRIEADVAAGRVPFFVCATAGTTSTHAFDPVEEIAKVAVPHGLWVHVDAAHAGAAAVCPELRAVNRGLERADSYCMDPHKWLFTGMECDAFYVADRRPLTDALSVTPEYLRNAASDSGAVIDYRDWHVPLGRRFRALRLWFVIRHYGAEGLRETVRAHVAWAQELAGWIDADPRFERVGPTPLNLVCFRHRDGDEPSEALLEALNRSGRMFLTHTRVDGRYTLRMCIGGTATERHHVEAAWDAISATAGGRT